MPTVRPGSRHPTWWLHPFLVSAFPVVYLFAANLRDQVSVDPLWQPLGLVLAATGIALVACIGLGRLTGIGPERAALAVSVLAALTLTYGHAWNVVEPALGAHRYLLVAWGALAMLGLVAAVTLTGGAVRRTTSALTLGAGALVMVNAAPIVAFGVRSADDASTVAPTARASAEVGRPATGPDVWYIVPDRYAGADALRDRFGYDNEPFLTALRDRGFVVAEHATATYLKTAMSLVSSLNMEELDFAALSAEASAPDDWGPVYRRLQSSHAVERFLHERGYRYVHVGSRRGPTSTNAAADAVYLLGRTTEFDAVLVDTTILAALENVAPDVGFQGTEQLVVDQTTFQFRILDQLADDPASTFVFAHVLVPHPPFVFNADGSRVTPEQRAGRSAEAQYVEQLRFTNRQLLSLVDRLQSGPAETWPVIVIAADEGPFPRRYSADEWNFGWLDATEEELLTKYSTLAAISVPGADRRALQAAGFRDDITPLNLFRVVLNAAFDADLEILPQRNWAFVVQRDLYEQVDVTDRVRAAVEAAASD